MDGETFGPYRLEERLSSGGHADIFIATDPNGTTVVLRRLRPDFLHDRERRQHFLNGCRIVTKFDHPNVIRQLDAGEAKLRDVGVLPFQVLEYIPGMTLGEAIRRRDPLASYDPMGLLLCMANGLSHIHDRGYLHLDFKPDNVLINRETGEVRIIDFDLAIPRRPGLQKIQRAAGTPHYVSPEEIEHREVDERADVFAFGVTAYEVWTGQKPLGHLTTGELPAKYRHFSQHLRPPKSLNPRLPANVEKIILRCLQQDLAARYPAMGMVLRDLAAD